MEKYDDCIINKKDQIAEISFNPDNLESLQDIVFLQFSVKQNDTVKKGDRLLVLESMKGTSELESKIAGKIVEINKDLEKSPEILNKRPTTWLVKIKI